MSEVGRRTRRIFDAPKHSGEKPWNGANIQKLVVWQKAMELVTDVYETTHSLPANERFGLLSQIRRAAISVPSNIAEGAGRHSDRDFLRFLAIANGSLQELETQLLIAARLNYLKDIDGLIARIDQLFAMLSKLRTKLA